MNRSNIADLLKHKDFLLLWISQMLSQFTIQIMNFYVLTRVYEGTGSALAVSLIWVAGAIPSLVLGPFSGTLVDRWSRRSVLISSNILQAITVFLAVFVNKSVFPLYLIVFLYWLLDQFYYPAQQAQASLNINKNLITTANSLFLFTQQISIIIGFGLGGLMIANLGGDQTVFLASLNLLIAAIAVSFLPKDKPRDLSLEYGINKFSKELKDGIKFIKSKPILFYAITLIIMVQVFLTIISNVMPIFSKEILNESLSRSAIFLIIPGGIGALITTYLLSINNQKYRKMKIINISLVLAGISMLSLGFLQNLPISIRHTISLVCAIVLGGSVIGILTPSQSAIHQLTPNSMQGRIFGHLSFLMILSTLLPLFVSSAWVDLFGVSNMMSGLGFVLIAMYIYISKYGDKILRTSFRI